MSWETIITALVGGGIGLAGEFVGRLGSRRQAERTRIELIEDAERIRSQAIEDERRREKEARAVTAAENILAAYRDHPIKLMGQNEEVSSSIAGIVRVMDFEMGHLPDPVLRRRLIDMICILDLRDAGEDFCGYTLAEVGFLARNEAGLLIGAWIRGDPMPDPTASWMEISQHLDQAAQNWQRKVRESGLKIEIPPPSTYS